MDYEYWVKSHFGVGLVGEYSDPNESTWIVGTALSIHPNTSWKIVLMPGVEISDDDDEFLFRIGTGYEFEHSNWIIPPGINVDFVNGEEIFVAGVSIGQSF